MAARVSDATSTEPEPTVRDAIRGFAAIVRSHPQVRTFFDDYGPGRVMVFLGLALLAAGAALHWFGVLPLWVNVPIVVGAIVFGVGSYVIELVYVIVTGRERVIST